MEHPSEANRHQVNTANELTTISVLYMDDGTEVFSPRGWSFYLKFLLPGISIRFTYVMRRRKNRVTVPLVKMNIDIDMDEEDDPVIQFGPYKPLDGQPIK